MSAAAEAEAVMAEDLGDDEDHEDGDYRQAEAAETNKLPSFKKDPSAKSRDSTAGEQPKYVALPPYPHYGRKTGLPRTALTCQQYTGSARRKCNWMMRIFHLCQLHWTPRLVRCFLLACYAARLKLTATILYRTSCATRSYFVQQEEEGA